MGPLLNPSDIKDRLDEELPDGVLVATTGMRELRSTFGQVTPAVYILRQTVSTPSSGGAARMHRQTFHVRVEIAVVAVRFEDGQLSSDQARLELCQQVFDALHGWTPPGASLALSLETYTDGDPSDAVNYGVQMWGTDVFYQKAMT